MMRPSGRTVSARLATALLLIGGLAGVASADAAVADVPEAPSYVVSPGVTPGAAAGEVCGDADGQGHVDFRIGFGAGQRILVNGVDVGGYDAEATYHVVVECRNVAGQWLATTHIINQTSGLPVFHQLDCAIAGEATQVRVVADDVALSVN